MQTSGNLFRNVSDTWENVAFICNLQSPGHHSYFRKKEENTTDTVNGS